MMKLNLNLSFITKYRMNPPQNTPFLFDEHQDLSTYAQKDLIQLLELNTQTSKHYETQILDPNTKDELKSLYQMSKDIVDSDIADIRKELEARGNKK